MLTELSPEIIDHMLVNQHYGRIACAADGRILVEPMMYYYDGKAIWGLTREGAKTDLLRKNSRVAFEIDEIVNPGVWRSVMIEGEFEELHDDDRDYGLYLMKHHKIPVFADEKLGYPGEAASANQKVVYPVVYRIQIQHKTGRAYTHQLSDN